MHVRKRVANATSDGAGHGDAAKYFLRTKIGTPEGTRSVVRAGRRRVTRSRQESALPKRGSSWRAALSAAARDAAENRARHHAEDVTPTDSRGHGDRVGRTPLVPTGLHPRPAISENPAGDQHWAYVFDRGEPMHVLVDYIKRVLAGMHTA